MAAPTRINLANFTTLLVESTQGRAGTPDGNVFFDYDARIIELIGLDELATVDLGSGPEANPLTNFEGIEALALKAFENDRRRVNEANRNRSLMIEAAFRLAGSVRFIGGARLADVDVRKIRGSGFIYVASNGGTNRIYHSPRSLNAIEAPSQPYYQLAATTGFADLQAAAAVDFQRLGPVDEPIQVFGDTANGDAGAGNFDFTDDQLVVKVRSFGNFFGQADSAGAGQGELGQVTAGYGVGESANPDNGFALSDVFGGAAVAPFDGMGFTRGAAAGYDAPFNEGAGDFSETIDGNNASMLQIRAFMDALAVQDADVDDGAGTYNGKRGDPLYTLDTAGRVVTRQGLRIINVPVSEQQRVIFTADDASTRTFPRQVEVRVNLGTFARLDPEAWVRLMFSDGAGVADFDSPGAVVVNDAAGVPQNWSVAAAITGGQIVVLPDNSAELRFAFDFSGNTQAGLPAGADKDIVALCEGDAIAAAALTAFTISDLDVVSVVCAPPEQTNL